MEHSHSRAIKNNLQIANGVLGRTVDKTISNIYLDAAQWMEIPGMQCIRNPASVIWRKPGLMVKIVPKPQKIYVDRGFGISIKSEVLEYQDVKHLKELLIQVITIN